MAKIKLNIGGVITEVESEEISKGIETGEIKIESDDFQVLKKSDENIIYKKDEFETFKTNLANEEYKKGKTAGSEMLIKEAKDKYSLEFEGKTIDNFAESFKNKIISEANIKPTEQITELEKQNKLLRESFTNLESEYTGFKTQITEKETRAIKDNEILGFIPDNIIVDKDIALLTLKAKAGLDIGDGGVALFNGQTIKDKLQQDITLSSDIVTEKLKALNLLKPIEGGKGGGDEIPGGKNSYDSFVKEMKANDTEEGSQKFSEELNKRIKDKTLVM